jgi:hypothetical protein
MGCHTWYRKPIVKGKENVQKYLIQEIENQRKEHWWNKECEDEVPMRLQAIENLDENMDDDQYSWVTVNSSIRFINGEPQILVSADGFDTDEPRIGGYPDTIIKSTDEMFKAMETGLLNWEGKHFNFYWDKDREQYIRNNILEFFKAHPDGIIEFG